MKSINFSLSCANIISKFIWSCFCLYVVSFKNNLSLGANNNTEAKKWLFERSKKLSKVEQVFIFLRNDFEDVLEETSDRGLSLSLTYVLSENLALNLDHQNGLNVIYKSGLHGLYVNQIRKQQPYDIIGTSFGYPPFTYYDEDGNLGGFEVIWD